MAVECHYYRLAECLQVLDVAVKVLQSVCQSLAIGLFYEVEWHSAMHLQPLCGGYDDCEAWLQSGLAAFNVEELLGTEVGTESGFGHYVVAECHGGLGSKYGVAAVCYVGKRSAMNDGRCLLCGLHQVGMQRIEQQDDDGSAHSHVFHPEGLAVDGDAEQYVVYASAQVVDVGGQTEYGHYLACRGYVEPARRDSAVGLGPYAGHHLAQGPVVDVDHSPPVFFAECKTVVPMLVNIVVQECGNHVVCSRNCMKIAGEMEVYFLHRQHLCISAAGSSALHAEAWTERGFAQCYYGFFADAVEAEGKADAHRGLPDAGLGGGDGGDEDEMAFGHTALVDEGFWNFGYVAAIGFDASGRNSGCGRNVGNGCQGAFACNFDVGLH